MDNPTPRRRRSAAPYQGVDGYTPIALYLGNEGWNLGLELRAGRTTALETEYFFERAFPRLRPGSARPMRSCRGGPTAASTAPAAVRAGRRARSLGSAGAFV